MCMLLYIGSDNILPLIEWQDNKNQLICVRKIDCSYDDRFASEHLANKYQYSIISWQGCGCGFQFDYNNEEFDDEYNKLGKQSLEALFNYIHDHVQNDDCELFSMWAGKHEAEYHNVIDFRDFKLGDSFKFLEGQYITIYK